MFKKLNFKALALLLFAASIFMSCEDQFIELPADELGTQYYPVEMGKYWIYQVDTTIVLRRGEYYNSSSFVREEIVSDFINSAGDTAYILQRSISNSQSGPFISTDRWVIEKTNQSLIRIEENLRFVKMNFPIVLNSEWDGNQFDQKLEVFVGQETIEQYLEWEYKVLGKTANKTINGVPYDKVLEIQQANYETEIEERFSHEWYAPDVGLIYRKMDIFDTQCFSACDGMTWIEKADEGFTMTQTLVEHN